ncbi:MAG: zinc-dependent peptidase [Burkholderiaceae bacterium]|nr:zinc-dependent peptidase [Burkholderiaceae bacterium]
MLKALLEKLRPATQVAIDDALWRSTIDALPFLGRLDAAGCRRLRDLAQQFLADKEFAAAGDLQLTAAMQVSIAAQACLPVLELGLGAYRGWRSIVVYPDQFLVPREITDEAGVVHEYVDRIAGEAWDGGPLLLSWADATLEQPGYNVVIHEFTHKLDMANGEADGLPPFERSLHPRLSASRWRQVLDDAFERLSAELDLIESEIPPDVDPESSAADAYYARLPLDAYAATDPGEFFAVSSEVFFVSPGRLRDAFPAWYALLAEFFLQDPLARTEG